MVAGISAYSGVVTKKDEIESLKNHNANKISHIAFGGQVELNMAATTLLDCCNKRSCSQRC